MKRHNYYLKFVLHFKPKFVLTAPTKAVSLKFSLEEYFACDHGLSKYNIDRSPLGNQDFKGQKG